MPRVVNLTLPPSLSLQSLRFLKVLYRKTRGDENEWYPILFDLWSSFPKCFYNSPGPPRVAFSWRHWAKWTGPYKERQPTGELLELFGVAIVEVDDKLKIKSIDVHYDPNQILMPLEGGTAGACPFHKQWNEVNQLTLFRLGFFGIPWTGEGASTPPSVSWKLYKE